MAMVTQSQDWMTKASEVGATWIDKKHRQKNRFKEQDIGKSWCDKTALHISQVEMLHMYLGRSRIKVPRNLKMSTSSWGSKLQ